MTEPLRVLYEIHPQTLGGTERFLARFLERLDRRLYEPLVISQKNGRPLQLIHSMGVRTEVVRDYLKARGTRQLTEFIRRNRIGLVQSNYYSANLAMAANRANVPHVWRPGGHVEAGGILRHPGDAPLALDIMRILSKAIICNSHYVRSQFRGRSVTPRIEVIQNGIATQPRAQAEERNGHFRVGMIAHLTPQKRHVDFIRAAEVVAGCLKDVTFTILGSRYSDPASRGYATEVRRRARSLERLGKLSISEFAESEPEAPGRFDLVVLPSVRESFSNAILEAMAAGVPVIAARSGGNPELVEHGKTGLLVPPMRPAAIARAILLLRNDPKLLCRMGEAARQRAQTRFFIDDCVRSYEAVYARVVS